MARTEIFAGNWKMYKTFSQAESLVKGILDGIQKKEGREIVLFPPSPYVRELNSLCRGSDLMLGIQNMHFEKEGAFTGEVSPEMVKDCGCQFILIGHSERRHVFGETDDDVRKKTAAALEAGLRPMVCVGELLEQRESGSTNKVVEEQVKRALDGISSGEIKDLVIAYEPVWAIGTGKVATPEIADEVHGLIRDTVSSLYSADISDSLSILYGGSVKPDNIEGLSVKENIDGVLVGGASLKPDSFLSIINV
jgi:triosephosphate isomerase (TIM)